MKTKREEELEKKTAKLQAELRTTKMQLRDVKKSKENFKATTKSLREELNTKKKPEKVILSQSPIDRHKYSDLIVELCVTFYVKHRCGLQQTANILSYLNDILCLSMESIPAPNSIKNWVLKAGYSIYNETPNKLKDSKYALIVDESMMIGSEKLLLTLAVESAKTEGLTMSLNDTDIIDMSVEPSWNSKTISDVFSSIETKTRNSPAYVISDNASTLSKAIRESDYTQIRDVGHSFALILKRVYEKNESFISFTKALSDVTFKENMKTTAYLLPPKQRTAARFMNVAPLVKWGQKVLKILDQLPDAEQKTYSSIKEHEEIINELSSVIMVFNNMMKVLKTNGLSQKTVKESKEFAAPLAESNYINTREVSCQVNQFLDKEVKKVQEKETVYHCSSDIIESLFGNYKSRKSKNKLNGVTSLVFILPVMTRLNDKNKNKLDFKKIMEKVYLREIHQWIDDNLTDNLVVKRRKAMSIA